MDKELLGAIALMVLVFGLFSRRLERSPITPPMAYVCFGLLISSSLLGLTNEINITNEAIKILAEVTLAVLLFTDASRIQIKLLRQEYRLPLRLLGIGLPLTIAVGTMLGLFLFKEELNLWSAAVLATILAPTDAALGQAVVNSEKVPGFIRQAINVESGLNDGICLPILLLFLSLSVNEGESSAAYWLSVVSKQIGFGAIVGILIGFAGSKLIIYSLKRKWITVSFESLSVLGLSILAYTAAEILGGNGFISAFLAGLTVGWCGTKPVLNSLQEFGEAEGQLLSLVFFLLFGAVMVIPSVTQATVKIWIYGIASLVLVRFIGVAMATVSLKLQGKSIVFLSWFGPRGIASLVYGLTIVEQDSLRGSELIFSTMVVTVLTSIFAHGLTAFPGVEWYSQHIATKHQQGKAMPEMNPVEELPVRLPWK